MDFQKQKDAHIMVSSYKLEQMKKDFMQGNPIMNSYPIELANGSVIEELSTSCDDCGSVIPPEYLRGTVSIMNNNNTISNRAVGHCQKCLTLWVVEQRIKSDGSYYRVEFIQDGKWVCHSSKDAHSYLEKAINILKSIFFVFNSN